MELKYIKLVNDYCLVKSSNRTFMELKLALFAVAMLSFAF